MTCESGDGVNRTGLTGEKPSIRHAEQTADRKIISPATLLADNCSDKTIALHEEWEIIRRNGQLILELGCDDARSRPSWKTAQLRTIAIGGNEETFESYEGLINDKSVNLIIAVGHYDGDTVKTGIAPIGCGGLDVKLKQENHQLPTEGGSLDWVHEKVAHHDPVVQAIISATRISRLTTKPVLAAVRNHLTGDVLPIAVFKQNIDGTTNTHSSVNIGDCIDGSYSPANIYKNGVPHLEKTDPLIVEYSNYFADNTQHVEEIAKLVEEKPEIGKRLKTQDPDAIVISTQTRPLITRYSEIFANPGSAFEITAARSKKNTEAQTPLTNTTIKEILQQLDYAAMKNALNPEGHGFRNTRTILIENRKLEEAKRIAQAIAETELGIKWLAEGRQIIIAEVRGGKIIDGKIENFYLSS